MIPVLLNYTTKSEQTLSHRVVAPDFIGFVEATNVVKTRPTILISIGTLW